MFTAVFGINSNQRIQIPASPSIEGSIDGRTSQSAEIFSRIYMFPQSETPVEVEIVNYTTRRRWLGDMAPTMDTIPKSSN